MIRDTRNVCEWRPMLISRVLQILCNTSLLRRQEKHVGLSKAGKILFRSIERGILVGVIKEGLKTTLRCGLAPNLAGMPLLPRVQQLDIKGDIVKCWLTAGKFFKYAGFCRVHLFGEVVKHSLGLRNHYIRLFLQET